MDRDLIPVHNFYPRSGGFPIQQRYSAVCPRSAMPVWSAQLLELGQIQTGALANYGSPVIDMSNATACKASKVKDADQRNFRRFADGNGDSISACDIGAYEYNSTALTPNPGVDTDPPFLWIEQTPSAPYGTNGWYQSQVSLLPNALDDSEIIELRCALDLVVPPTTYGDLPEEICPFIGCSLVIADGPHTFYAAAMDIESNQSEVVSTCFQIDTTAPALTCPAAGPFLLPE